MLDLQKLRKKMMKIAVIFSKIFEIWADAGHITSVTVAVCHGPSFCHSHNFSYNFQGHSFIFWSLIPYVKVSFRNIDNIHMMCWDQTHEVNIQLPELWGNMSHNYIHVQENICMRKILLSSW